MNLPDFQTRKRRIVNCPHCQKALSSQYLPQHIRQIHHALPDTHLDKRQCIDHTSHRYNVILQNGFIICPVNECPSWTDDLSVFQQHACIMHPFDRFHFIDFPHNFIQCPKCGKYLTSITRRHLQSAFCRDTFARREHLRTYHRSALIAENSPPFQIGEENIEYVDTFEYLGRVLSRDDSDDMAIFERLQKTRKTWGQFSQLLQGIGASPATMGRFYRTIIHATLLHGSASWVPTNSDIRRLERFQARCARYMTHQHIRRDRNGTWIYPHTADMLAVCHIQPVQTYIRHRKSRLLKRYAEKDSQLFGTCLSEPPTNRFRAWWASGPCRK